MQTNLRLDEDQLQKLSVGLDGDESWEMLLDNRVPGQRV